MMVRGGDALMTGILRLTDELIMSTYNTEDLLFGWLL